MISVPPRDTTPHKDSAGTVPSGTPPPAQPPLPPQTRGTQARSAPTPLKRPMPTLQRGALSGNVAIRAPSATFFPRRACPAPDSSHCSSGPGFGLGANCLRVSCVGPLRGPPLRWLPPFGVPPPVLTDSFRSGALCFIPRVGLPCGPTLDNPLNSNLLTHRLLASCFAIGSPSAQRRMLPAARLPSP